MSKLPKCGSFITYSCNIISITNLKYSIFKDKIKHRLKPSQQRFRHSKHTSYCHIQPLTSLAVVPRCVHCAIDLMTFPAQNVMCDVAVGPEWFAPGDCERVARSPFHRQP